MHFSYLILNLSASSSLKLRGFMNQYSEFEFSGRYLTVRDAVSGVLRLRPDLIFLDLDNISFNGFEMLTKLHQYVQELPRIIALSKTRQHAYEAIKLECFDYWLMPWDELDILKSIMRLKKKLNTNSRPKKLCLKSHREYHYVDTDEILYLKADNNATDVYMADGRKINAYKSLKKFEQRLPENFVRVHQSYMLNTKHVERINYGKAICSLKGQKLQLPFSKTYKENIDGLKRRLTKESISSFL